jgi:DNA-binding transcriptional MerR regulator/methylmalonyl-CoA mutase cobalamin-binding subunit
MRKGAIGRVGPGRRSRRTTSGAAGRGGAIGAAASAGSVEGEPYKIGRLSRLTGFSPALLRVWERRFGLLQPERGPGGQRWYDGEDLRVLRRVRLLLDEGQSIGEIARRGLAALHEAGTPAPPRGPASVPRPPAAPDIDRTPLLEWRRRIVQAAVDVDSRAMTAALDDAFAGLTPERAVHDVVEPAAIEVGRLWATGRCSVAGEHLASDRFLQRVRNLVDATQPQDPEAPVVLAACFPDEQHHLGLLILAWHVAREGIRVDNLGAALPFDDLRAACRASRARAVLLSVSRPRTFRRHAAALDRLLAGGLSAKVFIGGRGTRAAGAAAEVPGAVVFAPGTPLSDAVARVVAEVRGRRPRAGFS